MDTQRLILLLIFSFSVLMLWDAWQRENAPPKPAPNAAQSSAQESGPPKAMATPPAASSAPAPAA